MNTMPALSALQLDALREVANVASGHGATALAQLLGRRTMITTPEVSVARIEEIPSLLGYSTERAVIVAMQLLGDVTGTLVFMLPVHRALALSRLLLGELASGTDEFDDLAQSSLAETGNIIGGAYAGALGSMMHRIVMLSTPAFGIEPPDNVLAKQRIADQEQLGLCIDTRLTVGSEGAEFGGHIVLLPYAASLKAIFVALDQPLNSVPVPAS